MITVAAVWFLVGLIVIIGMLILAILKQIKWKAFGISTSIYIVVLFFLFVIVGSHPTSNNTKSSKSSSELASTAKVFKLVYNDDEDYSDEIHFESNKDGKYVIKVKGLHDGKIKLANKDDSEDKFKTRTYKIKKGQTLKIPIQLKGDDLVHDFEITDNNDNSKTFSIYNNSNAANSIADSMSTSESLEDQPNSASGSYDDSLKARMKNWNNSSDGDAIHVSKVWQDGHTTFVAVNEDDWDSLSSSDQYTFTSDWTNSIQDMYKMSDKNGTTSVLVVSSSNHYHTLAHGNGAGSVKVGD